MDAEICDSFVCVCCAHRCPNNDMKIGLADIIDPKILEIMISSETEKLSVLLDFGYLQAKMTMLFTIRTLESQFLTFEIYVISF
jgi:hypothetical protein